MDNAAWGQWLKQRRRALDLTQQALAQQVACGVTTIRKFEAGTRRPSADVAVRLAEVLDVPPGEHATFVSVARGEAPGSRTDPFAPQATGPGPPTNLLTPATALIGREHEVGRVRQLLSAGVRLLTLTGAPGIGKTRLSQQVAQEVPDGYTAGVFFIALAPIREPDLVLSALARTLGVKESGEQALLERLQAFLHTRQLLLVLDNFEQVLAAGPHLATLLAAAPRVQIMVTSRERLHLYGEAEYLVPPLELPSTTAPTAGAGSGWDRAALTGSPAVQLFVARAQAANPDFTLNRANAPAIAELCIRLEGLPLAIELAATHSKLFGPRALLKRLTQRLDLLATGAWNLPARQRTLRGALQWSYELLSPAEQVLFARLAAFVGGCTWRPPKPYVTQRVTCRWG